MLACMITLLMSCNSDEPYKTFKEESTSGYLPLEVGNYWDFRNAAGTSQQVTYHREVKGKAQLNGHEYYLITSHAVDQPSTADSLYYRVEENGDVYTWRRNWTNEMLQYKLAADDGDKWSYLMDEGDTMEVIMTTTTLDAGSRNISDCKAYHYNAPNWADEEYTVTLARGIGFVREFSDAWGMGMTLAKASIGGSVFEY